jgi:hypothetical protein
LIDQPRLHLDQTVLVAGQLFEFLHQGTVGLQTPQLVEIAASLARQQERVNGIRLSPRGLAPFFQRFGIHRVDGQTRLQQGGNQQPFVGFNDAGHLIGVGGNVTYPLEEFDQLLHPFGTMGDALLAHVLPVFINDRRIMVLVSPVNADLPHRPILLGVLKSPWWVVALYGGARGAAFYDRCTRKTTGAEGESSLNGQAGRGTESFRISLMTMSCTPTVSLSQGGDSTSLMYKVANWKWNSGESARARAGQ